MRILYLAPHPFFEERGTPIAVRMMVETLTRLGHEVDLLVYHQGSNLAMERLKVHRVRQPVGVTRVPIGLSWQKLLCDMGFVVEFLRLVRTRRYDVIHAGEEAAYLAWLLRAVHRLPYVVDMDSCLPDQIAERFPAARPLTWPLRWIERRALRGAASVTAVCESLAKIARAARPNGEVRVIRDAWDLNAGTVPTDARSHRKRLNIPDATPIVLYVGNLQRYQGIDLLLQAFAHATHAAALVVVGGTGAQLERYKTKAERLGLSERVHWLGARPLRELGWHLKQADLLASPRLAGDNTPMKIYSYLASGVPVIATRISGHTEVLDEEISVLVEPAAAAFAAGMDELLAVPERMCRLGKAARARAEERYGRAVFDRNVAALYEDVAVRISAGPQ